MRRAVSSRCAVISRTDSSTSSSTAAGAVSGVTVEGRLRCVNHVELDGLCSFIATQLGCESQGSVDSRRDPRRKDPVPVDDHPFFHRDRAEERQQMKRSPVGRRAASLEQAGCTAEQGTGAYGEDAARFRRLPTDPAKHLWD
jgi:hypothetical protein